VKKIILACIISAGLLAAGSAEGSSAKLPQAAAFKAGGTPIAIPSPAKEMNEIGDDNRALMDAFVAQSNRLIACFMLKGDLQKLKGGANDSILARYAMVQVPRRGEYLDCGSSDFKEVANSLKEEFGDILSSSMKETEDEFNKRMKSLDLEEATVSLGAPIQLGCLFSKQDAYCFGMIVPFTMGGNSIKMGMGAVFMRVKQRLLFVYLYSEYKDDDSIAWIRVTIEDWADAIIKANK
jgi:hypothetical protein